MINNYPSIGEYNQLILQKGGNAFDSLFGIEFIASRSYPIKVFLFGSGAYAAVFKGRFNGNNYAIRCFLSAGNETIERYKIVCSYLRNINSSWITKCELIDDEISVNGKWYPVLKMDWVEGISIHKFVSNNKNNNNVLTKLQQKLVAISDDLEYNKIGHGDLQSGNIYISDNSGEFQIKLIDYDGMYVDGLHYSKSVEMGRSEFQHPRRTQNDFNYKIDRFSFWVMITAIEALKHDTALWGSIVHGGFNTDDNFLFSRQDFSNPNQSTLFNRLNTYHSTSLNYYIDKLKWFCNNDIISITKPILFDQTTNLSIIPNEDQNSLDDFSSVNSEIPFDKYRIVANVAPVTVISSTFKKLGLAPLEIEKTIYKGKTIIVTYRGEIKRITLSQNQSLIEINFIDKDLEFI